MNFWCFQNNSHWITTLISLVHIWKTPEKTSANLISIVLENSSVIQKTSLYYWWHISLFTSLLAKSILNAIWIMINTKKQCRCFSEWMCYWREVWMWSCAVIMKVDKRKRVRHHFCLHSIKCHLFPMPNAIMRACSADTAATICYIFMFGQAPWLWAAVASLSCKYLKVWNHQFLT